MNQDSFARAGPTAVVFTVGSAFIACGFAGEAQPRHILSLQLHEQSRWSDTELRVKLASIMHSLYFDCLQINPHDRPAVVCTNLLAPRVLHSGLAWVLFAYLQVPSVLFLTNEAVLTIPLRLSTAMMIDLGHSEARILPIYEGALQIHALQTAPLAGSALNLRLSELLKEKAVVYNSGTSTQLKLEANLPDTVIEDIKIRLCRIKSVSEHAVEGDFISYPLNSEEVLLIHPTILADAGEVLFEGNEEDETLASLVVESIKICPIDSRCALAQNIVIVGGTAMLPGMKDRIVKELETLIQSPKYEAFKGLAGQFCALDTNFAGNLLSWVGGSVVGCVEHKEAISLKQYSEKNFVFPEWMRIPASSEKKKHKEKKDKKATKRGPFELTPTPITSAGTSASFSSFLPTSVKLPGNE